jgi:hypothetical protein
VAGIVLLNTSFPNSSYTVNYKPVMDNVTCRKAIAQVAELAGGYARITRDGKLEIFNISTTAKNTVIYAGNDSIASADFDIADELIAGVINVTRDNYITFTNKELSLATIDTVSVKVGDVEAKLGGDENPYYIIDNIFCQNPDAVINELYNTLNGLGYMPFNSKWQGNPAIDPGDMITIKTVSSQYNTIATSRKLTYRGGLREEYTAVGKSNVEKNSTPKGNLTLDMNKAKTEIKVLDGKIEQRVTKDDFETYTEQTDAELKARVSRGEDLKTEVTQNADSWKISINGKLKGSKYEFNGEGFTLSDDNYTTLISPMGVASCDTIFATDNVDSGKPLVMKFYIDESVNVIDKVLLRFSVQPFRAYSTAAASGGGGAVTSASGGSVSKSSGGADSSATNWDATGSAYGISLFTLEASGHSHQFNLPSHTHSMKEHTHNVSITSHDVRRLCLEVRRLWRMRREVPAADTDQGEAEGSQIAVRQIKSLSSAERLWRRVQGVHRGKGET